MGAAVATIWRARDRAGREVALTEMGEAHILERHPELVGAEQEIRTAIEAPDTVTRDATIPHRECLYRRSRLGRPLLKVVVQYRPVPPQGTWAGEVVTVLPVPKVKRKERRLWP